MSAGTCHLRTWHCTIKLRFSNAPRNDHGSPMRIDFYGCCSQSCGSRWQVALKITHADTVRRWRRQGLWKHLGWRHERKRPGRPPIAVETQALIRRMSRDNGIWGAPRIHSELALVGIGVSRTTVAKYMDRQSGRHLRHGVRFSAIMSRS